ncbi:hypothetical protein L7F22_038469 [Adiantum nelumboides]|nr:hypothetical protein [Adiantum nelumboides]
MLGAYNASMFKRRLRVNKETFHYLCKSLAPFMQKKTTNFRAGVSIEDRVAIALSRLATGDGLMGLGDTYGCPKSTCCGIVLDFCKAIVKSGLRNMYIRWSSRSRLATLAQEFEAARGIPLVVRAIDGSHIPIIAPRDNHVDYFNKKGFHSILLQLTVAANCSIWNYDVGWAGSGHDSLNFSRSDIGQACARGELGNYCLVGDCAYPARPYMLVPFKGCTEGLSRLKYYWNFIQSSTRMPVERAFGMLKARFCILLKRCDMNLRYVPDFIAACLVLHNICIQHGESFDMEWVREAEAELSVRSGRVEEGQRAVRFGRAEEGQRGVATSLQELQATREVARSRSPDIYHESWPASDILVKVIPRRRTVQDAHSNTAVKELQLRDAKGSIAWRVPNVGMMEMLDTGELLIYDSASQPSVVWRCSEERPTDSLFQWQVMKRGMQLYSHNSADMARMEIGGLVLYSMNANFTVQQPPYWILPVVFPEDKQATFSNLNSLILTSLCSDGDYAPAYSRLGNSTWNLYFHPESCTKDFSRINVHSTSSFNLAMDTMVEIRGTSTLLHPDSWSFLKLDDDGRLYVYVVTHLSPQSLPSILHYALDSKYASHSSLMKTTVLNITQWKDCPMYFCGATVTFRCHVVP